MKRLPYYLVLLVAIVCVSCKETKSEFTPYILTSDFYINPVYSGDTLISAQDTIKPVLGADGIYYLDTIQIDDKVTFQARFGSLGNDLISARITHDTLQLNMYPVLGTIQAILLPTSNVRLIQLDINPGFNLIGFPVVYTPMKTGVFDFVMQVVSDSQYSPRSVQFRQPVR